MKNVLGVLFVGLVSMTSARADLNCISTLDSNVSLKVVFTPLVSRVYQVKVDATLTNHNDIKEFNGIHQPYESIDLSLTKYSLKDKDSTPVELLVSTFYRVSPGRGRAETPTIITKFAKLKLKDEVLEFKCK